MPCLTKRDKLNNGYHGFELLNKGMITSSYLAKTPDGQKVFFKQFSSPSVRVEWYPGFKQYQQEIKARIEDSGAAKFCNKWYEQFEACVLKPDGTERPGRFFNQTYEFLESWSDMEEEIEKARSRLETMSFPERLIIAQLMMKAIEAIHGAGVVHTDLKPWNLMLRADDNPHAGVKYEVRLIGMDFAVQVDQTAPWDGKAGYTGTPEWFSPEHKRGEIPVFASDVFTCGLILCEFLCGKQPLHGVDEENYLEVIEARSIAKPTLLGRMEELGNPGNSLMVEEIIYRCLDPDPAHRPTAAQVNEALNNMAREEDKSPIDAPATQTNNIPDNQTPKTKVKSNVDYIFLIDSSSSMAPCFETLKHTVGRLLGTLPSRAIATGDWGGIQWRAKVVGYRNFRTDTVPLADNPFTDDQAVFKGQLEALKAEGGGDGPRSLLEAIYHVATMGQTKKGEPLSPVQWRHRSEACRMVIIFTDAPYHETMEQPKGGTLDDVANACDSNKIRLRVIAPEMECYDELSEIDKTEWLFFEYDEAGPEGPVKALQEIIPTLLTPGAYPDIDLFIPEPPDPDAPWEIDLE